MTSTPTPEPERQWVCHKPGWMGPCSPQSTHHNGFDWGCGWIYFPAPSTPGEGTGRPDTAQLREAATNAEVGGIVDETIITAAADWIDAQPAPLTPTPQPSEEATDA